jgi:hypothetical protein
MIAGDSSGHRVSNGSQYYYFLFTDRNGLQETGNSISLARVKSDDLTKAIAQQRTPVLHKYFVPSGGRKMGQDFFTEAGLGGRSTPVISPGRFEFINSPYVIYDSKLKKFILSYQVNQKKIVIRTADDLYHWSFPVEVVNLERYEDQRLFNPSLVGLGADPQVSGGEFYVYYLQRSVAKTGLREPRLMRVKVTLNSDS